MRFAIIDWLDCIAYESDNVLDCTEVLALYDSDDFKGIYDYEQNMYLNEVDILDIVGCQIHDNEGIGVKKNDNNS